MKLGNNDISNIYLGTTEISKVYLGSDLVYSKSTGAMVYTTGTDLNITTSYPIPTTTYDASWNPTESTTYPSSLITISPANQSYTSTNIRYTPTLTTDEFISNITATQVRDGDFSYDNITYYQTSDGSQYNAKLYWDTLISKCVGNQNTVNCYNSSYNTYTWARQNVGSGSGVPTIVKIKVDGLEANSQYKFTTGFSSHSSNYSATGTGYWKYLVCTDSAGQNVITTSANIIQPYGNYQVCRSGTVEFTTPANTTTVYILYLLNSNSRNMQGDLNLGYCQFTFWKKVTHYGETLLLAISRTIYEAYGDDTIQIDVYPIGYMPATNVLYTLEIDSSGTVSNIQEYNSGGSS